MVTPGTDSDRPAARADVVQTAEYHVVDGGRVDVVATHHGFDHVRGQVGRVYAGQSAATLADGGAHCVNDVCLSHGD